MEEIDEIEDLYNSIPQQIIAVFTTKLTNLHIDATEITISTDLNEHNLNHLLKNLMESQIDQQTLDRTTFEFLVEGQILRGKLKSHLVRYEIKCEHTINIEYVLGFQNL